MILDKGSSVILQLATLEIGTNDSTDRDASRLGTRYQERFEQSKCNLLSRADWGFAALVVPMTYDSVYEGYYKPLDCQRIIGIYDNEPCCGDRADYVEITETKNNQTYIKCTCGHYIRYVSSSISVLNWNPAAREALIMDLASHLAFSAGRIQQAAYLAQKAADSVRQALLLNNKDSNNNFAMGISI